MGATEVAFNGIGSFSVSMNSQSNSSPHGTTNKILLAVTGGIAAYKSAELCRGLIKQGFQVRVIMSSGAQEFIKPLTFQALSGNPVHTELLDPDAEAGMGHIELAKWPDLILVAPATANFIASYAQGLAGDLLGSVLLATDAKVYIAPAMNQAMWRNPLTQRNLKSLQAVMAERLSIIGPDEGEQACGDVGPGRMLEPEAILEQVIAALQQKEMPCDTDTAQLLQGRRVLITAGPTREAIDPVRFISNHSSGKMGYALARACRFAGAEVAVVSGPVNLSAPDGVAVDSVESACEMLAAVDGRMSQGCDIFIATAAVADYRPEQVASQKMKKNGEEGLSVTMVQNPDIVANVAARESRPFVVGFAAETHDVVEYAKAKRVKKGLDMVVANDVSQEGIGFNSDDNQAHIVFEDEVVALPKCSKQALAEQIVEYIAQRLSL